MGFPSGFNKSMDNLIILLERTAVSQNYEYFNKGLDLLILNYDSTVEIDKCKLNYILQLLNHYNIILTPKFINVMDLFIGNIKNKRVKIS